jgi:hypothetical protein
VTGRKPDENRHLRTADRWNSRQRGKRRLSLAFSGVEGSGKLFEDSLLSCFSAIGPKAIDLPDTPVSGVFKPWPACEPCRTPARTPGCVEKRGRSPPYR